MAEKLIALQDINGTIKVGEHFEAPDRIFVALGLAKDADDIADPDEHGATTRRRTRTRQAS